MNPSDSEFPLPEDAALATALGRVIPVPTQMLERLHADRDLAMKECRATAAEAKVRHVIPLSSAPPVRRSAFRPWLAAAAAIVVAALATWQFWPRGPAPIANISPQGEVGTVRPEIAWENAADKSYNVWILPAEGEHTTAPALFVAKGVRSPVKFANLKPGKGAAPGTTELEPDKDYRVLICYAGTGHDPVSERLSGTPVKFRVASAKE